MLKNQKGFHLPFILLVILVMAVAGFAGFMVVKKNSGTKNQRTLAKCTDQPMLSVTPIAMEHLDYIAPLGGINPPDHTIPTDHMYLMFRYERPDAERYDVRAPGEVVATTVTYGAEIADGKAQNGDYGVDFAPCDGLSYRFSHINTLEGKLQNLIGANGEGADCRRDKPREGLELLYCTRNVDIKLAPGDVMGKVGSKHVAAMDLWTYKTDYKNPRFTSPEYHTAASAVCPLDYFDEASRTAMYAKVKRAAEPRCGQIGQDKQDTLQGSWFSIKDPQKAQTDWSSHLTLAHDSMDPNLGILAVAGKITDPGVYDFAPAHGTINREPGETEKGIVYCYQAKSAGTTSFTPFTPGKGKILLKLIDNKTMQAEHKQGNCSVTESLDRPTTYYR